MLGFGNATETLINGIACGALLAGAKLAAYSLQFNHWDRTIRFLGLVMAILWSTLALAVHFPVLTALELDYLTQLSKIFAGFFFGAQLIHSFSFPLHAAKAKSWPNLLSGLFLGLIFALLLLAGTRLARESELLEPWALSLPFLILALAQCWQVARQEVHSADSLAQFSSLSAAPTISRAHIWVRYGAGLGLPLAAVWFLNLQDSWLFLANELHIRAERLAPVFAMALLLALAFLRPLQALTRKWGVNKVLLLAITMNLIFQFPIHWLMIRASGFFFGNPFEEVQPDLLVLTSLLLSEFILALLLLVPWGQLLLQRWREDRSLAAVILALVGTPVAFAFFAAGISELLRSQSLYISLLMPLVALILVLPYYLVFREDSANAAKEIQQH